MLGFQCSLRDHAHDTLTYGMHVISSLNFFKENLRHINLFFLLCFLSTSTSILICYPYFIFTYKNLGS